MSIHKSKAVHRVVACSVAVAAVAAPGTAQARPLVEGNAGVGSVETAPPPSAQKQGAVSGFQWGDAGVGAGVVLVLGSGAALAGTRRRRTPRTVVG
jgi:hypothetical protein